MDGYPEGTMQPKVVEGVPVWTAYPRAEMDLSPFLDCLQALVSRDRWKLSASIAVLAYRIVVGDIVKRANTVEICPSGWGYSGAY